MSGFGLATLCPLHFLLPLDFGLKIRNITLTLCPYLFLFLCQCALFTSKLTETITLSLDSAGNVIGRGLLIVLPLIQFSTIGM